MKLPIKNRFFTKIKGGLFPPSACNGRASLTRRTANSSDKYNSKQGVKSDDSCPKVSLSTKPTCQNQF